MINKSPIIGNLIGKNFRARYPGTKCWEVLFAEYRCTDDGELSFHGDILRCRMYDEFGKFTNQAALIKEELLEICEIKVF